MQAAYTQRRMGEKFAQRLPGYKNMSMTKKYLDSRGQA